MLQATTSNSDHSQVKQIKAGVPQGPTLFNITITTTN